MGEHFVASALLKDVLMESMMTEDQLRGLVAPQVADLVIKVGRLDDICQVSPLPLSSYLLCLCFWESVWMVLCSPVSGKGG